MEINKSIGQIIRDFREHKELLVREVAALLERLKLQNKK